MPLMEMYPTEWKTGSQTKTCTQMFIAARGMIVSYQKIVSMETTKFPGTDEQINKRRCILQKNITQPLKRKRVYLFQ